MDRRQIQGFTLLEVVAVVIIIAILTAIASVQITGAMEKVRSSEAVSILGEISRAQFRYYVLNGKLTDSLSDLDSAYSVPEYFSSPVALNPVYSGLNETVARMSRNNKANTVYGNYILEISADNTITCDPNGGKCPSGY